MDTASKVTLAVGGVFLALIVAMLATLGAGTGCATGETQQLITYQNSQHGEWVTEPVYAECEGK
jgi:hypothetical protein